MDLRSINFRKFTYIGAGRYNICLGNGSIVVKFGEINEYQMSKFEELFKIDPSFVPKIYYFAENIIIPQQAINCIARAKDRFYGDLEPTLRGYFNLVDGQYRSNVVIMEQVALADLSEYDTRCKVDNICDKFRAKLWRRFRFIWNDAHIYNIGFRGLKPVIIDLL